MSTSKYTPQTISEESTIYSIPIYQRLFAWGIPQVKRLLEDLNEHFNKYPDAKEGDADYPYYLGMLTCIDNNCYRDLIDGQQRFTVMTLLAISMKQYYSGWEFFLSGGNRVYFKARHEDVKYLKLRCSSEEVEGYRNEKMNDAINYIGKYLNETFDDSGKILFAERVFKRLTVFITMLPEDYTKQPSSLNKYFEAMNATGKSLEQHEILKVNLLYKVEGQEDRRTKIWNLVSDMGRTILIQKENDNIEEYRKNYSALINLCREGKFEEVLNYIEEVENDEASQYPTISEILPQKQKFNPHDKEDREDSIVSFPELLLLVLDAELSSHHQENNMSDYDFYRTDHLIDRFELDSNGDPLKFFNSIDNQMSFYYRLLFYRLMLDYYIIRREIKSGIGNYTLVYRTLRKDNPSNHTDDSIEITSTHLKQYESMMYVSTEYYRWLKKFLLFLEQNANTSAEIKLSALKNIDKSLKGRNNLPPLSRLNYKEIDRYWFWKLDYELWERYNDESLFPLPELREAVKAYVFRSNRSIEHLHPQEQSHNTIWDEDVLNSFGNLAMISQSFNSTQSNENVDVKFARIKEQTENNTLQSIKMLLMYTIAGCDSKNWNEETAGIHAEKMYKILEEAL